MKTFIPTPERQKRRGESLVEMVVVMSVIAGLASMSWPTVRNSMNKSRLQSAASRIARICRRLDYWQLKLVWLKSFVISPSKAAMRLLRERQAMWSSKPSQSPSPPKLMKSRRIPQRFTAN